jgi:hypothetical protein
MLHAQARARRGGSRHLVVRGGWGGANPNPYPHPNPNPGPNPNPNSNPNLNPNPSLNLDPNPNPNPNLNQAAESAATPQSKHAKKLSPCAGDGGYGFGQKEVRTPYP